MVKMKQCNTSKMGTIQWQETMLLPEWSYPTTPEKNLKKQWTFDPASSILAGYSATALIHLQTTK